MSDRTIKLLLVGQDTIFRTGLRVVLEQFPDLQVVGEAETTAAALEIVAQSSKATASSTSIRLPGVSRVRSWAEPKRSISDTRRVDLVVLELDLDRSHPSQLGLQCRQLKTKYPNLPVLLLSSLPEDNYLVAARQSGVDGYCAKGTSVSDLVTAMRQVATGKSYWQEVIPPSPPIFRGEAKKSLLLTP